MENNQLPQSEHPFRPKDTQRLTKFLSAMSRTGKSEFAEKLYGKGAVNLREKWEAYHFTSYLEGVAEMVSIQRLDDALQAAGLPVYAQIRDMPSSRGIVFDSKDRLQYAISYKILSLLADIQDVSLLRCFSDLLEHCWQKRWPIASIYGDKTDFENLKAYIDDIRHYISRLDSERHKIPPNPYKGLEWFTENDKDMFFGRDKLIETLHQRVKESPFTAVIGASGSGKSSVLLAGVLPRLCDTGDWLLPICLRPTSSASNDPFQSLGLELARYHRANQDVVDEGFAQGRIVRGLKEGTLTLAAHMDATRARNENKKILILIDQFEELFGLDLEDPSDIKRFIGLIVDFLKNGSKSSYEQGVALVIAMRVDFMSHADGYSEFAKLISENAVIINPPDENGLKQAITMPAKNLGVSFEDELVDLIVRDAGTSPGSLPLMEYALTELWETQRNRLITHSAYHDIGGVTGALSGRADKTIFAFTSEEQIIAERVFLKLVSAREGAYDTKRIGRRDEFSKDEWSLILKLAEKKQRLLVVGHQQDKTATPSVEIVHESLIAHWERLRNWLEKNRNFLYWRSEFSPSLKTWLNNKGDTDNLLRGDAFSVAISWLQKSKDKLDLQEIEFIQSSIDFADAKQRMKREAESRTKRRSKFLLTSSIIVSFIFIALSLVLVVVGLHLESALDEAQQQKDIAIVEKNRAQINERKYLAKQSIETFIEGNNRLAALLALKSLGDKALTYDNGFVRDSVSTLEKINGGYIETKRLRLDENTMLFDLSEDGKLLVSSNSAGKISVWDLEKLEKKFELTAHAGPLNSLKFGLNGSLIVSTSNTNGIGIWNTETGELQAFYTKENTNFTNAMIINSKLFVLAQTSDQKITLFKPDSMFCSAEQEIAIANTKNINCSIDIGLWDEYWLDDNLSTLWASISGLLCELTVYEDSVRREKKCAFVPNATGFNLSPSRKSVVVKMDDNSYKIGLTKELGNLKEFRDLTIKGAFKKERVRFSVNNDKIIFNETENYVFIGGGVKTSVFDVKTGVRVKKYQKKKLLGAYFDFATDNSKLLMFDGDIKIVDFYTLNYIANLQLNGIQPYDFRPNEKTSPQFIKNSTKVVGVDGNSVFHVWSQVNFPNERVTLEGHADKINNITFSNNGNLIATASRDKDVRIWDRRSGKLVSLLKGHTGSVDHAVFSNDDSKILTSSSDKSVRIWNIKQGIELYRATFDAPIISSFWSDDDGSFFTLLKSEELLSLGNYIEKPIPQNIEEKTTPIIHYEKYTLFDPSNEELIGVLTTKYKKLSQIFRYTPNTHGAFYYKSGSGKLVIFPPYAISPEGRYKAEIFMSNIFEILNNKKRIDEVVITDSIDDRKYYVNKNSYLGNAQEIWFSGDGQYFYTLSNKNVQIWYSKTGALISTIKLPEYKDEHNNGNIHAEFSKDNRKLILITSGGLVEIWAIESGNLIAREKINIDGAAPVSISSDTKYIAWVDEQNRVIVLPIGTKGIESIVDYFNDLKIPSFTNDERKRYNLSKN